MNIPFKSKTEMIGYYILLGVVVVLISSAFAVVMLLNSMGSTRSARHYSDWESVLWGFSFFFGIGFVVAVGMLFRRYRARGKLADIKLQSEPYVTDEELAREILSSAEGDWDGLRVGKEG